MKNKLNNNISYEDNNIDFKLYVIPLIFQILSIIGLITIISFIIYFLIK